MLQGCQSLTSGMSITTGKTNMSHSSRLTPCRLRLQVDQGATAESDARANADLPVTQGDRQDQWGGKPRCEVRAGNAG